MDDKTNKYTYCYDCFRWLQTYPEAILAHQAIFQYDEVFSEWLSRLKYHGDVRLAKIMVDTLSEIYLQYEDYAWIILPSSPESIHERGFHSTAILLMEAGIAFSEPFDYIGDGRKQAKKARDERIQLGQSFQIKSDFVFNQSKYLIFDDVYTTGATLLQAKNLLRLALIAGESDALVESLTLAHHQMLD
ncbi:ComF family protein [Fundicoccus culcitae]|uniref:ComF family protein n=1 Tax=Fundicoccus culcitae TaxID=2969821 RepID=A0ABY5P2Z9_9LACT|nr:hypothetical protein [Fundicoccus culcitae]UUX32939.1 hypothetical protein NRE15_08405 [Fundicoccus culcitae]